ncbi:hypothetical protein N7451_004042 [Penicillium sp. IBT 35674x]|nr:hypothetical protein N7451_004042 [Penicillium sp. IBT 35674x]
MADHDNDEFLTELPEIPEDEFVIFGTVHAIPEHAEALEVVYAETTRLAQSEPGSSYYCICRDEKDRNMFHFFERYAGRQAFEDHNAQPIIVKLIADKWFRGVKAKFLRAIPPTKV